MTTYEPGATAQENLNWKYNQMGNVGSDIANAFDPNKNGFNRAFDPNQNGVANFFNNDVKNGLQKAGELVVNTAGGAINTATSMVGIPVKVPQLGSTPGLQQIAAPIVGRIPIVGGIASGLLGGAPQPRQPGQLPQPGDPYGPMVSAPDGFSQYGDPPPAPDNTLLYAGGAALLLVMLMK